MKICLIDAHNHLARHFHIAAKEYVGDDLSLIAVQRTLESWHKLGELFDETVVALDIGKSFRHILYPEYKGKRAEKRPELVRAIEHLHHELATSRPFKTATAPGYEADDLIARMTIQATNGGHEVTIASTDQDLIALLELPGVNLWKDKTLISREACANQLGFAPEHIVLFKAMVGDTSDNIPGLRGLGKVKALPVVQKHRDPQSVMEGWLELPTAVRSVLTPAGEQQLRFWYHMVSLQAPRVVYRLSAGVLAEAKSEEHARAIAAQWTGWKPLAKTAENQQETTPETSESAAGRAAATI